MKMFNLLNIGERAGAGIPNIFHVWNKEKLGVPKYEEIMNGSRAKLTLPLEYESEKKKKATDQDTDQDERIENLLDFCISPRSRVEIQEFIGISSKTHFKKSLLLPLLESGQLKMTIPEKPSSKNQKYVKN
jgi:ATP-dependent DNA helicase RecG